MSSSSPQGVAGGGASATEEVVSVTADHVASDGEVVLADASGGGFTVTLPAPDDPEAFTVTVKKTDATGNTVTVAREDAQNIDGDASDRTITGEDTSRTFTGDGTNYFII